MKTISNHAGVDAGINRRIALIGAAMYVANPALAVISIEIAVSLIAAITSWVVEKVKSDYTYRAQVITAQIEAESKRLEQEAKFRMFMLQLDPSGAYQGSVQLPYYPEGGPVTKNLALDVDGYGTELWLSRGHIATARNGYRGVMTTAEAGAFSEILSRREPMPVLLDASFHPVEPLRGRRQQAIIESRVGSQVRPISMRRFASKVYKSGRHDVETIHYRGPDGIDAESFWV